MDYYTFSGFLHFKFSRNFIAVVNCNLKMSINDAVVELLTQVAAKKGFTNFEILPDDNVIRGDGFLSEFYTGRVKDKDTGVLVEAYIKFPPQSEIKIKDIVFVNEFAYYSTVYPALERYQKEKGVPIPFNNIPHFYCGSAESIVLENLKTVNYNLYDKTQYLDQKHLEAIFELYGKYHALTFSFKKHNQETYDSILSSIKDVFSIFPEQSTVLMTPLFKVGYESVKAVDEAKAEKLVKFYEDPEYTVNKATSYKGKYSTLVHGDCWSNNMMFKYTENGDIEDIKLVDHQLLRDSTPVHDLSYFFYSGASKTDFEKLDYYLDLYYKSFSQFAKLLGNDPEEFLPFQALKEDWQEYSFFGIRMSIIVWQAKLISKEEISKGSVGKGFENIRGSMEKVRQSASFKSKVADILLHAIDRNII